MAGGGLPEELRRARHRRGRAWPRSTISSTGPRSTPGRSRLLADLGHRLGLHVSIAPREQGRRTAGRPLAALLAPDERGPGLAFLGRAGADAVEQVDCLWYARPRFAFLFEVEWTAMLGEPVLRRGRRIAPDDRIVRFLVTVPERVELLRAKLATSPVLRRAMDDGNWHILRLDALRRFAALPAPSLEDLEPYLGLDPPPTGRAISSPSSKADRAGPASGAARRAAAREPAFRARGG